MTCRNYIPGPNGDCQRCGEIGTNHAGTNITQRDKTESILRDTLSRYGEMIAGHAGRPAALHEALGVLYSRLHGQMSPAERHELLEAITILKGDVEMRAGHAGVCEARIVGSSDAPVKECPPCGTIMAADDPACVRAGHAGSDTPKVKRYNIHAVSISEEPDGEWVRYDDIESKP